MCLHEPYFTATVQDNGGEKLAMIRTPLWENIVKSGVPNVDILSLPEQHKYRQSGLGEEETTSTWSLIRHLAQNFALG